MKNSQLQIPDTWVYKSKKPGNTVTILGGVHGNESAGIQVVDSLKQLLKKEVLKSGTLQLAYGNTQAMHASPPVRSIHPKDMNKSFGHPVLDENGKITFESLRANLLKGMLAQSDVMFDVHSTIKPSHPHIIVPNLKYPLAASMVNQIGIPTVITGKGLFPPSGDPIYTDTFTASCGGLGMTIEAGWSENPDIGKIQTGIINALMELGILHGKPSPTAMQAEYWDAYWNVIAGDGFKFTKEFGNFEKIQAGESFAESDGEPLSVETDSIILYPKSKIVPAQEACIIAKKVEME